MVKRILIASSFVILSGCYEQNDNSCQIHWAIANKNHLEKEILKIAKDINPYPANIAMDSAELRKERRRISNQISNLKESHREKCRGNKNRKDSTKPTLQREGLSALPSTAGNVISTHVHSGTGLSQPNSYDCIKKIGSDPLILDLERNKGKLDTISRKKSEHDKKLYKLSHVYAKDLINEYSKSKMQVVVDGRGNNILYNSSGVTLDITEALISMIDENHLQLVPSASN